MITNLDDIFRSHNLYCGRMILGNKRSPEGCICVFNANIIIRSTGKIWYGDINITKEGKKLKQIAEEFKEPLYVLREHDASARFDTINDPIELLISKAVWSTEMEIPIDKD